jgi:arylsulfate sulfotransferase
MLLVAGCASPPSTPVSVSVSPPATAIGTGQTAQFTANVSNNAGVHWSATAGTIDANGNYLAPSGTQSLTVTVTATSITDPTKYASATVHVVAPGQVSPTASVQVALYSITPGAPANVSVQFGPDKTYGLTTWTQPVPQGGGAVSLFVAGMKASTPYHLRGTVQFSDGTQFLDADTLFTTGALPAGSIPTITATTTDGMTPQSGVELLDGIPQSPSPFPPALVTDLQGNVLWVYNPGLSGVASNPVKLLPNGHFMINFSSSFQDGLNSVLQEVDLSGALIWQMTAADLNNALAAATCAGCNITVTGTHHDFLLLPNGHLIVIAGVQNTTVVPGTTVIGDVIIDLDQNHKPVWLWNEFDHLDINRRPYLFPDWTHTNAVIYSPDDGNLIVSLRHQSWLIKVDYANGTGAGKILWKLGYQGDFTLMNGTDPTDWFYAQHGPSFVSTNTTGQFALTMFDNGDDRLYPDGGICATGTEPPCYSTVPILQLNETVTPKTATLVFNPTTPLYSFFGGNSAVLKNGNVEYCDTAGGPGVAGEIYEITETSSPEQVWSMKVTGEYLYRGQRIPSLYPGVQW